MAVRKSDPALHIPAYDPSRARCHTGRVHGDGDVTALSPDTIDKLRAHWGKPQHRNNAPASFR